MNLINYLKTLILIIHASLKNDRNLKNMVLGRIERFVSAALQAHSWSILCKFTFITVALKVTTLVTTISKLSTCLPTKDYQFPSLEFEISVSTLRISIYFVTGEAAKRTKQDNVLFGLPDGSFVMVGETTASDLDLSEFHEFFPEKLSPFFWGKSLFVSETYLMNQKT